MQKVSVCFDVRDVDVPVPELVDLIGNVEGVSCHFSAFSGEVILSSRDYDSYDLESIFNKYVEDMKLNESENSEPPLFVVDKVSVVFSIDDMGSESSSYIVKACEEISDSEELSAKPLIGNKILIESSGLYDSMDIVREVTEYFKVC